MRENREGIPDAPGMGERAARGLLAGLQGRGTALITEPGLLVAEKGPGLGSVARAAWLKERTSAIAAESPAPLFRITNTPYTYKYFISLARRAILDNINLF